MVNPRPAASHQVPIITQARWPAPIQRRRSAEDDAVLDLRRARLHVVAAGALVGARAGNGAVSLLSYIEPWG